MKKVFLMIMLMVAFMSTRVDAQSSYNNALGFRLTSSPGLTFKHFMNNSDALEFMFGTHYRNNGFTGSVLFEKHMNINVKGLDWYFGIGGTIGFWDSWYNEGHKYYDDNGFYLGLSGILGIEYTIPNSPINVSLDMKPTVRIMGPRVWGDGALSVRYIFN